jgi:hypothetical protein
MAVIFVDEAQTSPIYISTAKCNRGSALWLKTGDFGCACENGRAL